MTDLLATQMQLGRSEDTNEELYEGHVPKILKHGLQYVTTDQRKYNVNKNGHMYHICSPKVRYK